VPTPSSQALTSHGLVNLLLGEQLVNFRVPTPSSQALTLHGLVNLLLGEQLVGFHERTHCNQSKMEVESHVNGATGLVF